MFANRLMKLRKEANLSQREVSTRLGITHSQYSKWENDKSTPNASHFEKLCRLLNCSPNDLFEPNKSSDDTPTSLFRYRTLNAYTLYYLLHDQLGASKPSKFNDPYDSFPSYNDAKLAEILNPESLLSPKEHVSNVRESYFITSLSSNVDNTALWSHYANNGKGFAISYKFETLQTFISEYRNKMYESFKKQLQPNNEEDEKNIHSFCDSSIIISRVDYVDESYDITDDIIEGLSFVNTNENITVSRKINLSDLKNKLYTSNFFNIMKKTVLPKSLQWSYEQEWRIIVPSCNTVHDYIALDKIKPNALYLGEFISETDKIILMGIAKHKSIPVFQCYTNYASKNINKLSYQILTKSD